MAETPRRRNYSAIKTEIWHTKTINNYQEKTQIMVLTPAETLETIQHNLATITNKHTSWGDPDHTIILTLQKLHQTLEEYHTTEPTLILHLLQAHFVTLYDNTTNNKTNTTGELSEIQEFIVEQYLLTQFALGNTN